jgi:AraC-like DNA-binding protein
MNPSTFFRYLPASEADKKWGLFATTVGHTWYGPHSPYPLGKHPQNYHFFWENGRTLHEFQIIFIARGKGQFESATQGKKIIHEGDAFLLFPGEWHRYLPDPETGWDEYWIGFDGKYIRNLIANRVFSPAHAVFETDPDQSLLALFSQIIETVKVEARFQQQMLAASILQTLVRLNTFKLDHAKLPDSSEAAIQKAKCILAERLESEVDLATLAVDLGFGYSNFRRIFKHYTGFSPYQYHLNLRFLKAKSLLSGSNASIKSIADQLGFECPFHFSRLFKKKTGLSPGLWRRQAHGGESVE